MPLPKPAQQAARILAMQRNIVLPAKLMVTSVVLYYLFYTHWLAEVATPREVVLETLQRFFILYVVLNSLAAIPLILRRIPPGLVQWLVFITGLLDGLLLAGLTILTGGFESNLFWVFPGLIIINALSIPLATPQIVLNLSLSIFYLSAGVLNTSIGESDNPPVPVPPLRHRAAPQQLKGPATFSPGDIRDLSSLVDKLEQQPDEISKFLWNRFSPATRQRLSEHPETATKLLRDALVSELNLIILDPSLASNPAFAGVKFSEDTRNLQSSLHRQKKSREDPETETIVRLNRSLLEDAYPLELSRSPSRFMGANTTVPEPLPAEEPFLLRLIILWLLTLCCYGVQLLAFRDRLAEEEAQEFAARNSELSTAGRLAAEIAHQLKNPLGIINNAAYSLQRALKEGKALSSEQVQIIREEIERSDRIITQLMGYAELSEGRVEKLSITEELDRAINEVFPARAKYGIEIRKDYSPEFAPLLMQRGHLSGVLVNLLQNAREALHDQGHVHVSARALPDYSIEIVIADDGPGVPVDKLGRIFEPYFTTKEKGTGLGLAIVKHNLELYGGTIRVESKLGKGARFVLLFPAKRIIKSVK